MEGSASPGASGCSRRDGGGGALLPFGEAPDGRLLRASDVPAGLACGCSCPGCGAPLLARRGGRRAAHFAHATGRACAAAHETVLHRLTKQLIAGGTALGLPAVAAKHGGRRRLVRPAAAVRPEAATLEPGLDGLRPDVLATVAGRPLLVEVAATMAAAPSLRHPGGARLAWGMEMVREAGLGGAVGVVLAGDGCFAVPREVWQSHLVSRHVLGGVPLDERAALASLSPLLRDRFAEPRPGGFEWADVRARFPGLRPPCDVLADYARRLGLMGLLARGTDGLWRPTRAAARARCRRDALAAQRRCPARQAACRTDPSGARPGPTRGEAEPPRWKVEGIADRLDQPDPDQSGRAGVRLHSGAHRARTPHRTA